ncbi:MAG: TIGR00282 family metallophosphoesterase, partial [Chloroflexota bacterium]|nr:TIGR00282 family metallophosphoesterase [Chloroflexota bacterium]
PGRLAVCMLLPGLRREYGLDLVVANGENAAGGIGITPDTAEELLGAGVDVITTGNHIWDQREAPTLLESGLPVLRPLNYPPGVPGCGSLVRGKALVVNLMGRVFMGNFDCPFRAMDSLLKDVHPPVVLVDFHAEATSEKGALGWYLRGRASAVVGTHTHVGTIDAKILPGGTGFVSDLGMCGPSESIIGDEVEGVLARFLTLRPHRISVGRGDLIFNSILLDIEEDSGRTTNISRLDRRL